jgi:small subunit ribosomal protein S18
MAAPGRDSVASAAVMARPRENDSGPPRRGRRGAERARPRKYTRINSEAVDYKDLNLLRRFLSDKGKTRGRRVTGLSRKHQRQLSVAVKRAREIALLPYVGER